MELRQAIHEDAVEKENVEPGELLVAYVVISAWTRIDDDGNCEYVYHYDDSMKVHEVLGLLHMGIDVVMEDSKD